MESFTWHSCPILKKGVIFLDFFIIYKHCSTLRTSSAVPQIPLCIGGCWDGIEPKTIAIMALTAALYSHSARSHPLFLSFTQYLRNAYILFHNPFSLFFHFCLLSIFYFFSLTLQKILCLFYTTYQHIP
jgi:hypothetical protein